MTRPDIIIPAEKFEELLRSLFAEVTKVQKELFAELNARLAAKEAIVHAQYKAAHERKLKAAEEQIERKIRAVEEEIARKLRAAKEEIARRKLAAEEEVDRKRRAAEDEIERGVLAIEEKINRKAREADEEIARLRQLERLRHIYEAERDDGSKLQ